MQIEKRKWKYLSMAYPSQLHSSHTEENSETLEDVEIQENP